ncbi:MAG: electron transfer flavoprotein subunit alpha/FixB family protein [Calditrichaeota bacterium]|nr:electron transfer flavoprotein subunit alpha/FixB family protein [Calditrichota bacterium]
MSTILVFCDSKNGKLKPAAREAVTGAMKLAQGLNAAITAVIFGECADAASLGAVGAKKVIQLTNPELSSFTPEGYAQAAAELATSESPVAIVLSASANGKDFAPRLAARINAPLLADCTDVKVDGGAICALRPIYAGKVMLWAKITAPLGIVTLRPKAFLPVETGGSAEVVSQSAALDASKIRAKVASEKMQEGGMLDVTEADVVVSGGRGMKGPENWHLLEELAGALGGSVGASRAVVDAGWRPHHEQVGQTGKVVSPSLYIAVGISGAIQHLAGMTTSRTIVAINKDADAPIFKVSTYGIVGDALEILPQLTAEVKKAKAE